MNAYRKAWKPEHSNNKSDCRHTEWKLFLLQLRIPHTDRSNMDVWLLLVFECWVGNLTVWTDLLLSTSSKVESFPAQFCFSTESWTGGCILEILSKVKIQCGWQTLEEKSSQYALIKLLVGWSDVICCTYDQNQLWCNIAK